MARIVLDAGGMAELSRETDRQLTHPIIDAVADDMRRYVPVLTGALRGTISPTHPKGRGRVYVGGGRRHVDYWSFVEYGTSRMSAQPYARPALYQVRG